MTQWPLTDKEPREPKGPQWPLWHEDLKGYVIPSGNHHEWPLEPPGPLRPLEPMDPPTPGGKDD